MDPESAYCIGIIFLFAFVHAIIYFLCAFFVDREKHQTSVLFFTFLFVFLAFVLVLRITNPLLLVYLGSHAFVLPFIGEFAKRHKIADNKELGGIYTLGMVVVFMPWFFEKISLLGLESFAFGSGLAKSSKVLENAYKEAGNLLLYPSLEVGYVLAKYKNLDLMIEEIEGQARVTISPTDYNESIEHIIKVIEGKWNGKVEVDRNEPFISIYADPKDTRRALEFAKQKIDEATKQE